MANNRFVFDGLAELRAALRSLPSELAAEASGIVTSAAASANDEIIAGYERHRRTGKLARGVKVRKVTTGTYGAGVEIASTAKHANLFENGTQARHTALGANRGSMPPGNVFIPAVVRARRGMYERLRELLTRHGLTVTGHV